MNVIKIETLLPDTEDLVLTRISERKEVVPAYSCIGGNMMYQTKEKSYPELFTVLKTISKNGTWLFWSLVEQRNHVTNIAVFKAIDAKESRKITQAYKELLSLNMIKRIKRQHYLINPKVMLPQKNEYKKVRYHWDSI